MKELDIIELKMINGGYNSASEQLGYAIGRTAGILVSFWLGSRFLR